MNSGTENWKGCFVKDIQDNQSIEGVFLVKEMSLSETKAGKPFLTLTLMDKSGEITARVWDNAERLKEKCQAGEIITLSGMAQSYKGSLQLNVKGLQKYEQTADMGQFLPSASGDPQEMIAELKKYAMSIDDVFLKQLLSLFFKDANFVHEFSHAPAAKHMHHAYIGGLLEHTLGLTRLADEVTVLYPSIDRSLLLCGTVLHDIGKIKEFSFAAPPFDYSDQGRLVGHMVLAIEMINEKIAAIADFPGALAFRLKHLILSHHGRHEFGSPTLPMIREAFVLNFLDDLDAKINYIDRLCSQVEGEGYQWTPFQRTLERFLFVPGHAGQMVSDDDEALGKTDGKEEESTRQPSLWEL